MPAAVKVSLEGFRVETEELEKAISGWEKRGLDHLVPAFLSKVPQEVLKKFPHTKRVGSYLVGKMINKGSFAKVMEGLHIGTGEKVAIKVIDKKKAKQDSYVLKNMKREPRIQQMIQHPHIVQLYETMETENSYYMVMELCLGGDLMERICEKQKLEEREVRKYTRQIMSAVDHLHRHGIVHRDLKIENFLLDEYNNIKIVDFGLSNTLKPESLSPELLNTQCGSPAYAAPELLARMKYGPKVDVWSIGVSMFAMLTGTLPFTVEPFNVKHLLQKMMNGDINPIPADISKGAAQFMMSLLEPDPTKRPNIKEAMEAKWINEGYIKRPLNSLSYKNRLRPDELNPIVLNCMTENMGFNLADVVKDLVNNRPSAIMANYCLLCKKLAKHQKKEKSQKKQIDWNLPSKTLWNEHTAKRNAAKKIQKETATEKTVQQANNHIQNHQLDFDSQNGKERTEKKAPCLSPLLVMADVIIEDDIAITVENKESCSLEGSSPLPRLRANGLQENMSRRITWFGTARHRTHDTPLFQVNGSKPALLPSSRQPMITVKRLPLSKEKTRIAVNNPLAKRNSVQIRQLQKTANLNLPVLSPPFQSKSDKKAEVLKMDYG
ncbi:HUNK kinase, partial [Polypterus senegalus]